MPTPAFDDDALRALIPRLRRFARTLARDPAAADDLVQATLEKALTRAAGRRDDAALQPWLFSILYRRFVDDRRRAARWSRISRLLAAPDAPGPATPEQVHDARASLSALARLPEDQRALLMLVSVEGLAYRDAAEVLGIPVGTVMSRLSRARRALRAINEAGAPAAPAVKALP
ncbi:MAG TPA: sigma-70 family RNA polymerase sigma factor [Lysobacter sp.]